MKPSELIQYALDNNYCNFGKDGPDKFPFMCHSLEYASHKLEFDELTATWAACVARKTFQFTLQALSLHASLVHTDPQYKSHTCGVGRYSEECFLIRIEWWKAHIKLLKSQGL